MSAELKCQLQSILFRDLILNGNETCVLLINTLVARYLDDSANTDAISGKLREVCPSFYRVEDALCAKINEQLMKAASEPSRVEKERLLQVPDIYQTTSLEQLIESRISLSGNKLSITAGRYQHGST